MTSERMLNPKTKTTYFPKAYREVFQKFGIPASSPMEPRKHTPAPAGGKTLAVKEKHHEHEFGEG